jgi:hypothetical protein
MKSHGNPENTYSLHNVDNFNKTLDTSVNDVVNKYTELVVEYLKFIYENIKVQNLTYSKFIVTRGLETITNVFSIILYYTKNIDLTYFQCQKSFYYYIEFIGQITEEQHTFLQLNSRDAITYVYKKTFFEINNDFKKNMLPPTKENIKKFDLINEYIKIYKIILLKIINTDSKINTNYIDNFEIVCVKLNNTKIDLDNLNILESLITILNNKINNIDNFLKIILFITKKINKKIDFIKKIKDKICQEEFDLNVETEVEVDIFISWISN